MHSPKLCIEPRAPVFRRARVQFWALPRVRPAARWRANSREPQAERYPYAGVDKRSQRRSPRVLAERTQPEPHGGSWQNEPNRNRHGILGRTNPTEPHGIFANEPNRAARHLGQNEPNRSQPVSRQNEPNRNQPVSRQRTQPEPHGVSAERTQSEPHGVSAERTQAEPHGVWQERTQPEPPDGNAGCSSPGLPLAGGGGSISGVLRDSKILRSQQQKAIVPLFGARGRRDSATSSDASSSLMRVCRSLSTGHQHKHVS